MGVDEIRALTSGYNSGWSTVAKALGGYKGHWERLRVIFEYDDDWAKESAVHALKRDPGSYHLVRECLDADDDRVRHAATWALGDEEGALVRNLDRLRALLVDPVRKEQATAIRLLKNDDASRPTIRALFRERLNSADGWVIGAAVEVCATDPLAHDTIAVYLHDSPNRSSWGHEMVLRELARHEHWRPMIRNRVRRPDPDLSAVQVLCEDPGSWPLIRALLAHNDAHVRAVAASSLKNDPGATDQLLRLVEDSDQSVRHACIASLGGRTAAREQIHRFLDDSDLYTVNCAIEALKDDEQVIAKLQTLIEQLHTYGPEQAIRSLARHAARTRDWLWNYYTSIIDKPFDRDRRVEFGGQREAIVQGLAKDLPSKPYIRKALDDKDARVRTAAIKALTPGDLDPLKVRSLLHDPHSMVHDAAVNLAAQDPAYHGDILEFLKAGQEALRTAGFRLLIVRGETRGKLLDCMKSGAALERASALQALAHVSALRPSLYACLDDPYDSVFAATVETMQHDPEIKRLLRKKLVDGSLRRGLFNPSFDRAVAALAKDPEAQPLFEALSESDDNNVVAAVLGPLGDYPSARPRLRAILADKDRRPNEHAAAVEALAGDPDSRPTLLGFLHDEKADEDVRVAAVEALAEDDDADVQATIRGLLSTKQRKKVRHAAAKAIAATLAKAPLGRDVLLGHLREEDEDKIRVSIIAALERDPAVVPMLRERLRDPNSTARFLSVRGLRPAPERPAVPLDATPSLQLALHLAGHEPTPEELADLSCPP